MFDVSKSSATDYWPLPTWSPRGNELWEGSASRAPRSRRAQKKTGRAHVRPLSRLSEQREESKIYRSNSRNQAGSTTAKKFELSVEKAFQELRKLIVGLRIFEKSSQIGNEREREREIEKIVWACVLSHACLHLLVSPRLASSNSKEQGIDRWAAAAPGKGDTNSQHQNRGGDIVAQQR